jgi:membrane protease YdiL (CAAX protease family)
MMAGKSTVAAFGMPLVLLVPYVVYAAETRTLTLGGFGKLSAYIIVPVLLLAPHRGHQRPAKAGVRDFLAAGALAVPVGANLLRGIWTWPQELYFFRPLYSVCVGVYAFAVIRNLDGIGYKLTWRKNDLIDGATNFLAFALVGIPLAYLLHLIHFHVNPPDVKGFAIQFIGIYLTVAIPEEVLFRGVLQNLLSRTFTGPHAATYALTTASMIFGLAHLHHPPVPNWRYAILAAFAGIFYGHVYQLRGRTSASALTHTLVDTIWHFWF